MSTVTPKPLYHGQPTSSATTLYTCPASTITIIRHLRCVNKDTSSRTLQLWINGSADSNAIIATKTIPAGGEWEDDVYIPMAAGDTFKGQADTSSKITLFVGGAEIA